MDSVIHLLPSFWDRLTPFGPWADDHVIILVSCGIDYFKLY